MIIDEYKNNPGLCCDHLLPDFSYKSMSFYQLTSFVLLVVVLLACCFSSLLFIAFLQQYHILFNYDTIMQ